MFSFLRPAQADTTATVGSIVPANTSPLDPTTINNAVNKIAAPGQSFTRTSSF